MDRTARVVAFSIGVWLSQLGVAAGGRLEAVRQTLREGRIVTARWGRLEGTVWFGKLGREFSAYNEQALPEERLEPEQYVRFRQTGELPERARPERIIRERTESAHSHLSSLAVAMKDLREGSTPNAFHIGMTWTTFTTAVNDLKAAESRALSSGRPLDEKLFVFTLRALRENVPDVAAGIPRDMKTTMGGTPKARYRALREATKDLDAMSARWLAD